MAKHYFLKPTENQSIRVFTKSNAESIVKLLERSRELESEGDYEQACSIRYDAAQELIDLLPETDEAIDLDFSHENTRAAAELLYQSAIDNLLVGDAELAAALLESLLDADSEDHMSATPLLALCYIAISEWECFDDISHDLPEKSVEKTILEAWASFEQYGRVHPSDLEQIRKDTTLCEELKRADHPTDEQFRLDIESERPSKQAQARNMYLRFEPVISMKPNFMNYLLKNL